MQPSGHEYGLTAWSTMRAVAVAVVVALALCSAQARVVSGTDVDPVENDVVQQPSSGHADVLARATPSSWMSIARCAVAPSPLDCVEARSQVAVDAMLAHMSEARAAKDETALEPEVVDKVSELSELLVDATAKVMGRRLGLSQDDDEADNQLVEEGKDARTPVGGESPGNPIDANQDMWFEPLPTVHSQCPA
ncbi:uncharacterized protein LOC127751344 isoform X1 [Frankliniella occidentalis]|uniref:Uncharacterized protein LOC127751344 isoform X1 n=2 Tax=Frankliniella occidentalis TaxID=133901 RepID=A0A9C6XU81_FRAOC|nr:uncharacterized protein LOC127751344 isoform X1 [Frankliniella occidentalis]